MENELLYDLEYKVNEMRKTRLSEIKYEEMSVKDFLDLGFNNSYIIINSKWFNLGYKWKICKDYGYESSDFGELNKEQLNVMIKYNDYEVNDNDYNSYIEVSVALVNEEDSKYFIGKED